MDETKDTEVVVDIEAEKKKLSRKPRAESKWIKALKIYYQNKKYAIPKKGTEAYDDVRKIMESL